MEGALTKGWVKDTGVMRAGRQMGLKSSFLRHYHTNTAALLLSCTQVGFL